MTLEEIKAIVNAKECINMVEVAKELLKLKFKEGKLVTCNNIYMYDIGDSDLYLCGLSLINGNLICAAEEIYGGDVCDRFVGTIGGKKGFVPYKNDGIFLTNEAIKKFCKKILEDKTSVDFNFADMTHNNNCYFCGKYFEDYLNKYEWLKTRVNNFCLGKEVGCIRF